jgi:hypothetical protein
VVAAILFCAVSNIASAQTPVQPSSSVAAQTIKTGIIRRKGTAPPIAPLAIEADSGNNYVIKFLSREKNAEILMVYIGGGTKFDGKMPLGIYRIVGASGKEWYGEKNLFGRTTKYFELSRPDGDNSITGRMSGKVVVSLLWPEEFEFYRDGNFIGGQSIKLQKVTNGNITSRPISPSDFGN